MSDYLTTPNVSEPFVEPNGALSFRGHRFLDEIRKRVNSDLSSLPALALRVDDNEQFAASLPALIEQATGQIMNLSKKLEDAESILAAVEARLSEASALNARLRSALSDLQNLTAN